LCLSLLLGLLGCHNNLLEVRLRFFDGVGLIIDLALEVSFKGIKSCDFLIDESDTLSDEIFALEDGLLGEDGSNHFEYIGFFVEHLELSHNHFILGFLSSKLRLVLNNIAVFYFEFDNIRLQ